MVPREEAGHLQYGLFSGRFLAELEEKLDDVDKFEELFLIFGRTRGIGPYLVLASCLRRLAFFRFGLDMFSCDSSCENDCDADCCEGMSSSSSGIDGLGGVMTTQMKPTIRPEEHSCLKAINSQNWSSVLTLFQCPLLLEGVPPSTTMASVPRSGSSSSSSSRNLAFGSSGKCGTRQRGGAAG